MKKIFLLAFAGMALVACNDSSPSINEDTRDNSTVNETPPPAADPVYVPGEGDVTYRDNKLHVMRNGAWVETNEDVKLDNGVTITKSGKVMKEGKDMQLEEGVVINREGNFFDEAGQKIENAWDASKEGVKKAGDEIERGADKAGDKLDGDHHDDENK
ncbi:MAG: hypothetical protein JNK79_11485 [Chitinophagaceae bacterium]|nr:hypothetical protein [Chitinophagaceae bacterium]